MLLQIYRVYLYYFLGALNLWQHPSNVVFNVALFTGWEKYFLPAIPVKGWQRVILTASIYFMKWLVPRPKLFKWLQVCCIASHVWLHFKCPTSCR